MNKRSEFEGKPKSKFVKELIDERGLSKKECAKILKTSENYFNNKLYRDSFSFEDMLVLIYVCGYKVALIDNSKGVLHELDINTFPKAAEIINDYKVSVLDEKRKEYETLKRQLYDLQKRYGF